jgi:hypothetical protein
MTKTIAPKYDVRETTGTGRFVKSACEICGKSTRGAQWEGEPVEYWSADYALAFGIVAICKACHDTDPVKGTERIKAKIAKEQAKKAAAPESFVVVVYSNSRRSPAEYTKEFGSEEEARAFAATRKRVWRGYRTQGGKFEELEF